MNDIYNFELEVESDLDRLMCVSESINVVAGPSIYYDTTAGWNSTPALVAERGSIYVYSDRDSMDDGSGNITYIPGMKVGDGTSYLIDMPFIDLNVQNDLDDHINDMIKHITQAERTSWNNKVSAFIDSQDAENLVLSKTRYILEG